MTLFVLVRRARGESAIAGWTSVILMTLWSATAQGVHAWMHAGQGVSVTSVFGMAIGASFPLIVLVSSHAIAALAFAPSPMKAGRQTEMARPVAAPVPEVATPAKPVEELAMPGRPSDEPVAMPPAAPANQDRQAERHEVAALAADGVSQRQMAIRVGVSRPTVAAWLAVGSVASTK
jgi:hypothetical protein